MKKAMLIIGIFFTSIIGVQAKDSIPTEVEREITQAYQGIDSPERAAFISMQKRAYEDMITYIEKAEIPDEEKEGILRNVSSMYPNNYVMQKAEAISRVDHVKSLM